MYAKVFRSIFDGSLYGHFEATIVFLAMLVIADRNGTVDMTAEKLAAECGYPLDIVKKGIEQLQAPDPRSRTPDEDGRRIVLLHESGWGWQIVNYAKYRDIRSAEERREYFRLKKQEQRAAAKVQDVHRSPPASTSSHPSDADAEADTKSEKSKRRALRVVSESTEFDDVQRAYPKRAGGQRWGDARKAYDRAIGKGASHDEILAGVRRYADFIRTKGDEGTQFVQQAATFLGANEGWREPWLPPVVKRELSPVERVILANGGTLESKDERVVSEQTGRSDANLGDIFGDVRNPAHQGLRRIGS